jgi:O-antigen/teichoic acid export membrane protein
MIPFYTHYLSPGDYGTLELLDLSLTLMTIVLTMWLNASVVRHYNDFEDQNERNQAISTIFWFCVGTGVFVALVGMRFASPLSALILNTPDLHYYVSLESISFLISSLNVICLSYLRAQQKSSLVVVSGLISTFLSLSLNIYFIAVQHIGVLGVLYSSLISSTIVTGVLCVQMIRKVGLSFSVEKLRRVISFGAPLILTSAAAFTVNFSDRFFLRHFTTVSTVGVYALGYKFGFMLSLLVVQPFDMVWQTRIYDIAKQNQSGEMFSKLFEYYCLFLVTVALGMSVFIKEILFAISMPGFHDAYRVVPIVALAYIFQGTNRFFLAGTYIAKKTMRLSFVGIASATANFGLNLALIPRFGMLGAAWATAISFFLMSTLALLVSQRAYPIPYAFSRISMLFLLAALVYFLSATVALPSHVLQISAKIAIFAGFPIGLYLFRFFREHEIASGKAFVQAFLTRYRPLTATESAE